MHKRIKVLLTGGGTGGHIYPGVAIAKEFMSRKGLDCCMLITEKSGDEYIMRKEGIPYYKLPLRGMQWRMSKNGLADMYRFALSFIRAWQIISLYGPDLIIGLGAYASSPAVITGKLRGVVTLIQEQNLLPGKANLFLAHFVDGIFVSFPETAQFFRSKRVMVAGNPIRELPAGMEKRKGRLEWGLAPDLFTILVCGGSRGAHSVNQMSMEAFERIRSSGIVFQVIHQSGKEDFEEVVSFYKREGISAVIRPFYDHMMGIYILADLVISRSGAGAVSELAALGKPAILIPYPFAKADHQRINAEAMEQAGAAIVINEGPMSGGVLAEKITELIKGKKRLELMTRQSFQLGRPEAARAVCDQALMWLEEEGRCTPS